MPRPAALEEGRELGNRAAPGQWSAGAVVYASKHTLKYGSHGAGGCRVVPEKAMRFTNSASATAMVRPAYREGYALVA